MKGVFICVVLTLAMVQLMVKPGQAAVSCGNVASALTQCVPYLTGTVTAPATECCNGVKRLVASVTTTQDKRQACNCVKQAASRYQNLKDAAASALPGKCGVSLGYPVSRTFNCDS